MRPFSLGVECSLGVLESSGSEAQAGLAPGQRRAGQRTPSHKSAEQD